MSHPLKLRNKYFVRELKDPLIPWKITKDLVKVLEKNKSDTEDADVILAKFNKILENMNVHNRCVSTLIVGCVMRDNFPAGNLCSIWCGTWTRFWLTPRMTRSLRTSWPFPLDRASGGKTLQTSFFRSFSAWKYIRFYHISAGQTRAAPRWSLQTLCPSTMWLASWPRMPLGLGNDRDFGIILQNVGGGVFVLDVLCSPFESIVKGSTYPYW